MAKRLTIIAICIALISLGVIFRPIAVQAPEGPVACTMEARICPDGTAVGRQGPQCEFTECPTISYTWTFGEKGINKKTGLSETTVSLNILTAHSTSTTHYELGTYQGSCFDMRTSEWPFESNQKAGAVCWAPGGGVEIGVFEENGQLSIQKAEIDEGSAELPNTKPVFTKIIDIQFK